MAYSHSYPTHQKFLPLPVSSCERCGERYGLKRVHRRGREEWHCFECRRQYAIQAAKKAERHAFLSRTDSAQSTSDSAQSTSDPGIMALEPEDYLGTHH